MCDFLFILNGDNDIHCKCKLASKLEIHSILSCIFCSHFSGFLPFLCFRFLMRICPLFDVLFQFFLFNIIFISLFFIFSLSWFPLTDFSILFVTFYFFFWISLAFFFAYFLAFLSLMFPYFPFLSLPLLPFPFLPFFLLLHIHFHFFSFLSLLYSLIFSQFVTCSLPFFLVFVFFFSWWFFRSSFPSFLFSTSFYVHWFATLPRANTILLLTKQYLLRPWN